MISRNVRYVIIYKQHRLHYRLESKLTTRNISRLYGAAYKFVDIADIKFCYFLFTERTK